MSSHWWRWSCSCPACCWERHSPSPPVAAARRSGPDHGVGLRRQPSAPSPVPSPPASRCCRAGCCRVLCCWPRASPRSRVSRLSFFRARRARAAHRARRRAAAGALIAGLTPALGPLLMSLGTTVRSARRTSSVLPQLGRSGPTRALAATQRVLYYRDGINASCSWPRTGPAQTVDGVGARWTQARHALTQVLLGVVPTAMADSGARTLVVGHGSGVTAAAHSPREPARPTSSSSSPPSSRDPGSSTRWGRTRSMTRA